MQPGLPKTKYAAVEERDSRGLPTRIALPARPAAGRTPLFVRHYDGGPSWAAYVDASGQVTGDLGVEGPRERALALIEPGTTIVAATDAAGRVVALQAVATLPEPPPPAPKRRSTAVPAARSSSDRYAHDPHEVFTAGSAGWVLGVR